jgi:hypothetical protein
MANHACPRPREDLEHKVSPSRSWYTWVLCLESVDGELSAGLHVADGRDGVYVTSPLSTPLGCLIRIQSDNLFSILKTA